MPLIYKETDQTCITKKLEGYTSKIGLYRAVTYLPKINKILCT